MIFVVCCFAMKYMMRQRDHETTASVLLRALRSSNRGRAGGIPSSRRLQTHVACAGCVASRFPFSARPFYSEIYTRYKPRDLQSKASQSKRRESRGRLFVCLARKKGLEQASRHVARWWSEAQSPRQRLSSPDGRSRRLCFRRNGVVLLEPRPQRVRLCFISGTHPLHSSLPTHCCLKSTLD